MFRKFALTSMAAAVLACAGTSANAAKYIFDASGDAADISFNGFNGNSSSVIAGITANLRLRLLGGAGTRFFLFAYEMTNTSTSGGPNSRVSGFAFNSNPDVAAVLTLGDFSRVALDGNYPNGIGRVGICLTGSRACAGGGNDGATFGDPASGIFTLAYLRPQSAVTLSDFFVRYQSLSGLGGISSASGAQVTTAVPEPGTWMLMILGLGAVGASLRRRRAGASVPTFA